MGMCKKLALFCAGGAAYVGLELLWRRRSHSSMFLAGGSSFLLLGELAKVTPDPVVRALGAAGIITGVELTAGLLFTQSHSIWDYRQLPYNIKGQICLPFCLLWVPVGQAGIWIYEKIDRIFPEKPQKPLDK